MKIVSFIQHFVFVNFNLIVRETGCDIQMGDETFCLVPRRLSLSMKICTQRKAGRRKRASTQRAPLLFLLSKVHCDSPPVTGVSRSPLCGINTKHLRRRKISVSHLILVLDRSNKNQYVVAEFYPWFKFSFLFLQNHTIPSAPHPPPTKKKREREKKISTKDKIEPQQIHLSTSILQVIYELSGILCREKRRVRLVSRTISKQRFRKSLKV